MTPAPAFAILAGTTQARNEIMRAVLFHAESTGHQLNWNEFILRRLLALGPPSQAEELAPGVWLLPMPHCQKFPNDLTQLLQRPLPLASAKTREVDCVSPWQPVS
jgi:hypothetical protein